MKPATYEAMEVGDTFGPFELVVDEALVRGFLFAEDDFSPWYLERSPFGGPIAPATLLVNDVLSLYLTRYDLATDRGIHSRQQLQCLQPIRIGQHTVCHARFVDKYVRRGKPYVVTEGEVRGTDGQLLLSVRGWEMVGMGPDLELGSASVAAEDRAASQERVVPSSDPSLGVVEQAQLGLTVGTPLPTLSKRITFKQMLAFSSTRWAPENMHTDSTYARSIGLPAPVAQGLMTAGYLSELCSRFFGPAWFTSGKLEPIYLQPVYADQSLRVSGVVRGQSPAATEGDGNGRLLLDVWCEDPDGRPVTVSHASADVSPRLWNVPYGR